MFQIKLIDHVVLRVADPERMTAFYRDVLGCPVEKVQAEFGLTQLRAGAGLIDLVDVTGPLGKRFGRPPGDEGRNVDHICLSIEPWNPEEIRAHLKKHGVEHGEVGRRYGADGYGPSIYLDDPEGNTVELKGPPDDAE